MGTFQRRGRSKHRVSLYGNVVRSLAASHSSKTFTISDISQSLEVTLAAIAGVMRKV